ncbi:cytochrome c oxidase subunit II [Georgenia sp. TF02-10]|uniref:aa3-type cytochrome oxidase subunit II n=1 Tax=Georgenia sp. TF02-10 TaxID=2917725 RepID=UPI001FA79398|nr:cytochrome c oxidase subunit II [Georgenia sp. TF02-10]UNX53424.1 cytochrome c oxidase subunit II [Georgenia sp. TF02-10]
MHTPSPHPVRRRRVQALLLGAGAALALAGCAPAESFPSEPGKGIDVGFLPSERGLTDRTGGLIDLWNGAWLAALAVGVLVWGLTIWCIVVYRKRKNDDRLPVQLRYHVPLELMYTVVPILMIGTLFFFSTRVTGEFQDTAKEPDVEIEVYGKQWSWDFNYLSDDVHSSGERVNLTGEEGVEETLPTLYLPAGETVEFTVRTRDVAHAFWIPSFLYKVDLLPGRVNQFQVTPQEEGTFSGKCAELCGEFHSEMLFNVEVVDPDTYDAKMDEYRAAGQTGRLGEELNKSYSTSADTDSQGSEE